MEKVDVSQSVSEMILKRRCRFLINLYCYYLFQNCWHFHIGITDVSDPKSPAHLGTEDWAGSVRTKNTGDSQPTLIVHRNGCGKPN